MSKEWKDNLVDLELGKKDEHTNTMDVSTFEITFSTQGIVVKGQLFLQSEKLSTDPRRIAINVLNDHCTKLVTNFIRDNMDKYVQEVDTL